MQVALFSDVHAIFSALRVFDSQLEDVDALWFLGDAIGYGPFPLQTLKMLRRMMKRPGSLSLSGNHDLGVLAVIRDEKPISIEVNGVQINTDEFRECARKTINAHADVLSTSAPELIEWMASWPLRAHPLPGVYLAHGDYTVSDHRVAWFYGTRSPNHARNQIVNLRRLHAEKHTIAPEAPRLIAVGHYHVPALMQWHEKTQDIHVINPWAADWHYFEDLLTTPIVLNPGSISLPRKAVENPCASYVLLSSDDNFTSARIGFRTLQYDCERVLAHMPAGYPCLEENLRQEIIETCHEKGE